ncbi:MAG: pentapeptide repeat-containing protein [Planctomycetota bacterium]|nr:pentapeptide repeat-containing protein [Planctomycetota bacterium]
MSDTDQSDVKKPTSEPIKGIKESLKKHEGQHRTLMTLCGIGLITFISINDRDLILHNNSSSNLPIVNIPITVTSLIWVLPLMICSIYTFYCIVTFKILEFFLENKKGSENGSGTNKTDEEEYDESMLKSFIDPTTKEPRSFASFMFYWMMLFASTPLTLFAFWIISLKKHDEYLTFFQIFCFLTTLFLSALILCLWITRRIPWITRLLDLLKVESPCSPKYLIPDFIFLIFSFFPPFNSHFIQFVILSVIAIEILAIHLYFKHKTDPKTKLFFGPNKLNICFTVFIACVFASEYAFSCNNKRIEPIQVTQEKFPKFPEVYSNPDSVFNYFLYTIDCNPFLNLRNAILSSRPDQWTDEAKDEDKLIKLVKGADLHGLDLRGADAERAFMARADLKGADLRGIYLRGANLCYADLRGAQLEGAYIRLVNFRNAQLQGATFGKEVFVYDNQDPMKVRGPNFQGARFDYHDLMKEKGKKYFPMSLLPSCREKIDPETDYLTKNLPLAFMGYNKKEEKAEFRNTLLGKRLKSLGFPFLTDKQLREKSITCVKFSRFFSLESANLDKHDLSNSIFDCVNLQNASFVGANLTNTSFRNADIRSADFTDADLNGTDFTGAEYLGAIFKNCRNANDVTPCEVQNYILKELRVQPRSAADAKKP